MAQCELTKSNYRNWLKAALALKVLKEVLTDQILHKNRNQGVSDIENVSMPCSMLPLNFRQAFLTMHYALKNLDSKRSTAGHVIVHTLMAEERYISLSDEADALGIVDVCVDEMTNELQESIDDITEQTGQQKHILEAFVCPLQKDRSHEVDILLTKVQALDVSDLSMGENICQIRELLSTIEIELASLGNVQLSRRRQLELLTTIEINLTCLENVQLSRRRQLDIVDRKQNGSPISECLELEVENIQTDGKIILMRIFDAWLKRSTFRSLEEKKVGEGNRTVVWRLLLHLSLKFCAQKLVDDRPDCSKKTKDIQSFNGPDVCLYAPVRINVSTVPRVTTDPQQSRSAQEMSEDTNTPDSDENISLTLRPKTLMCNTFNGTVDLKVHRYSKVSENLDDSEKKGDEKAVFFKNVIYNVMASANFKSVIVIAPVFKNQGENAETVPNSEHNQQDHDNFSPLRGNSSGFEEQSECKEDKNGANSAVSEVTMSKNQSTKHSNEVSVEGHTASGATGFTGMENNSTQNQSNQIHCVISPTRNIEIDSHDQAKEGSSSHTACENPVVTKGTVIHPSDLPSPEVDHSEIQRFKPLMQIIDKIADGQTVPPQITMRYEMLRFCTLRSFPKENKPFITRLAQAGFYYINSGDEVVCYTCARRKSNWREDDIPMDIHQQLNPNCKFLLQNSEVNIPIKVSESLFQNGIRQTLLMQQQNGYHTNLTGTSNTTFQNIVQNSVQASIQTSSTGFESTGQNYTTALSSSNDTRNAHQTQERGHSNFVQTIATGLMAVERQLHQAEVSSSNCERLSSAKSSQHSAEGTSLPTSPKYPKYASKTARVTSFNDCGDIVVSPDSLAEAGFFYASFGDCVRCFQCGVGLRQWSVEDDPWIEHSRWSNECSFVKAMKGQEFVNLVQMAVQYSQNNENEEASSGNIIGVHGGVDREKLMHTDAAQSVLEMGYHPDLIRKAIRSINELNAHEDLTATNLMEKMFELEEVDDTANSEQHVEPTQQSQSLTAQSVSAALEIPGIKTNAKNNSTQSQRHSDVNSSAQSNATLSLSVPRDAMKSLSIHSSGSEKKSQLLEQKKLKQENEKLKQQSICTKCRENDVCIVFLPCGHLVTYETCAPTVRLLGFKVVHGRKEIGEEESPPLPAEEERNMQGSIRSVCNSELYKGRRVGFYMSQLDMGEER